MSSLSNSEAPQPVFVWGVAKCARDWAALTCSQVFVKVSTPEAAQLCKDKIHGRMYGGQLVQVYFISDEAYIKV